MMEVGNKIRESRKRVGMNMKDFAKSIGVSYLTLFRIETNKVSPSVTLLSDIADQLGQPIQSFFDQKSKVTLVKAGTAPSVESDMMTLELLVPKGAVNDRLSISLGRTKVGQIVSRHSQPGYELTYHIKGRSIFKYGEDEEYEMGEGDIIYFDASTEHTVIALEELIFISVYFRK
jgi:DNA-binding XRE family transcriptional regulator